MKTKIHVISPLGYTGLAYYDYSLCQSLSERGRPVALYTSDPWLLASHPRGFEVNPVYRGCSGDLPKAVKGLNYLFSSARVLLSCIRNKAKVVHLQIVELPVVDLCVAILLRLLGTTIIFTPHDITHNKDYPLNMFFTSLLYRASNRIIVHKEANAKKLCDLFRIGVKQIRVVPHGNYGYFVDDEASKASAREFLGLSQRSNILLFFGSINPKKGTDVLIRAVSMLRKDFPAMRLVMAGRPTHGITEVSMLKAIEEADISDITMARFGFIPDQDILQYYMAADIVILPYHEASESGVLKYAQTCGRATVCSDLEEFRDTVVHGQTGYFFSKGDPTDLARQIRSALSNKHLGRMGKNSRDLMKRGYDWKLIAALTEKVYEELTA